MTTCRIYGALRSTSPNLWDSKPLKTRPETNRIGTRFRKPKPYPPENQNRNENIIHCGSSALSYGMAVVRAAKEIWSHAELLNHLRADDYHHVGTLPNNFAKTLSPMSLASQAVRSFKDEYLLDLVNLDNVDARYGYETDERVLSRAMVAEIEKTIAALGGTDFCFMAREKRLVFENDEFFVDLLFFHRELKAMVAIELKMGDFHPGYLGQLNFCLSALDRLMKKPDENPTVGFLLCETMNKPVVQLAVQGYSQPIGIATYQALKKIPQPYKALAPVIDGVRKVMLEYKGETAVTADARSARPAKKRKDGRARTPAAPHEEL